MQHCLFFAVNLEDESVGCSLVQLLLSKGASPTLQDSQGQTALFLAASKGHSSQVRAILQFHPAPNCRDFNNQTPLFFAVREGHLEAIRALASAGVEVNVVDRDGDTPLHYASRHGQMDAVKLLIDMGANVETKDDAGLTPKNWAETAGFTALATYLGKLEAILKENRSAKSVKKVRAILTKVSETGEKTPLSLSELAEFEVKYPKIARFWQSEEGLEDLNRLDCEAILEANRPWESRGKVLVRNLWKLSGASLFHEPVDPVKLGLPDYFEVVKKPMDLGTIKRKLNHNAYKDGESFMRDFQLMFGNCKVYNQGDDIILAICTKVENGFRSQAELLGLTRYIG